MKITIDVKDLNGPKPVVAVGVYDNDAEPKQETDGGKGEEKRFIYWWNFVNRRDGLTRAVLELDTGDVEKLKEILSPFCFDV